MRQLLFTILYILSVSTMFGQQARNPEHIRDSLLEVIAKRPVDSNVMQAYTGLSNYYLSRRSQDSGMYYARLVYAAASRLDSVRMVNSALRRIAAIHLRQTDFDSAELYYDSAIAHATLIGDQDLLTYGYGAKLTFYDRTNDQVKYLQTAKSALEAAERSGDSDLVTQVINLVGNAYERLGYNEKALKYYFRFRKRAEAENNKTYQAFALNNIALVYMDQERYDKALNFLMRSLEIKMTLDDKTALANTYNNIGEIYASHLRDYDSARFFFNNSIRLRRQVNNRRAMASSQLDIAGLFISENFNDSARLYADSVLQIATDLQDSILIAAAYYYKGQAADSSGNLLEAITYYQKALVIRQRFDEYSSIRSLSESLADAHEQLGQYSKAYKYRTLERNAQDTITSRNNVMAATEMQTKYDLEKAEAENELLKERESAQQAEIEAGKARAGRQQAYLIAAAIGLLLIGVVAFGIQRRSIERKKLNKLLTQQKDEIKQRNEELKQQKEELMSQREEITRQRDLIQASNVELTAKDELVQAAMTYAGEIQRAIFVHRPTIEAALSEHFVLYKPRDVISGDFYWLVRRDQRIWLAAADCTGHGVPGALMTMLGNVALNHIVNEYKVIEPDAILSELDKIIRTNLFRGTGNRQLTDGMDIALCLIDKTRLKLSFAGAKRPLIITENGDMTVLKGDRSTTGFVSRAGVDETDKTYALHEIDLNGKQTFYIYSDGITDQLGGTKREMYTGTRFHDLLRRIAHEPLDEQAARIEQAFDDWRGENDQTDDVVVIGFRV